MKHAVTRGSSFNRPATSGTMARFPVLLLVSLWTMAFCLVCPQGFADEVVLDNGDHFTGTVKKLEGGKLSLDTPYANTIEVSWGSIKTIKTDGTHEIALEDGTRLKGTLDTSAEGLLQVLTGSAGAVAIKDMASVKSVNIPSVTYKGDANAGASLNKGNTDNFNINMSGKFIARSEKQRLTIRGAWNYGEEDGNMNTRNANLSMKYDLFVHDKFYTYLNSLLEKDTFQDLSLRSTIGAGGGYQIFEDSVKDLSFELGVSYVDTNYKVGVDEGSPSGRWSITADYNVIADKIVLFHFHEGYFSFDDVEDLFLRSEQGVRLTIVKDFFTNFQVNVDFNNMPSPGKEKTDTKLIWGLGYSFSL